MTYVDIALLHYPVLGKKGETIGSAVTNLDLHDIARTSRTYGIRNFYVITPYQDQQELVKEIVDHWRNGYGASYNPARKEAFALVRQSASLDAALEDSGWTSGRRPVVVATSACPQTPTATFRGLKETISEGGHVLLLFGTAHGIAQEALQKADYMLPSIRGCGTYNHLSVRAAVAIICDRLLGERE